jgi:hypothetical protein
VARRFLSEKLIIVSVGIIESVVVVLWLIKVLLIASMPMVIVLRVLLIKVGHPA